MPGKDKKEKKKGVDEKKKEIEEERELEMQSFSRGEILKGRYPLVWWKVQCYECGGLGHRKRDHRKIKIKPRGQEIKKIKKDKIEEDKKKEIVKEKIEKDEIKKKKDKKIEIVKEEKKIEDKEEDKKIEEKKEERVQA